MAVAFQAGGGELKNTVAGGGWKVEENNKGF
jgi:hypothetical protein